MWTSDEDDVNSVSGKSKEIGTERGRKTWAPDGKKKGKSGRWNRSLAVSDLTECSIPVQQPSAKKKLKWASDPKSPRESVRTSDADKMRDIEKALGVSGREQERATRRRKWNKPQKDAEESVWDSDTILDD